MFVGVGTVDGLIAPPCFPCSRGQVVGTNLHLPGCVPGISQNIRVTPKAAGAKASTLISRMP